MVAENLTRKIKEYFGFGGEVDETRRYILKAGLLGYLGFGSIPDILAHDKFSSPTESESPLELSVHELPTNPRMKIIQDASGLNWGWYANTTELGGTRFEVFTVAQSDRTVAKVYKSNDGNYQEITDSLKDKPEIPGVYDLFDGEIDILPRLLNYAIPVEVKNKWFEDRGNSIIHSPYGRHLNLPNTYSYNYNPGVRNRREGESYCAPFALSGLLNSHNSHTTIEEMSNLIDNARIGVWDRGITSDFIHEHLKHLQEGEVGVIPSDAFLGNGFYALKATRESIKALSNLSIPTIVSFTKKRRGELGHLMNWFPNERTTVELNASNYYSYKNKSGITMSHFNSPDHFADMIDSEFADSDAYILFAPNPSDTALVLEAIQPMASR